MDRQIEHPTDIMPYELWYLAMKNLSPKDILSLCQTSKEFAVLCEGDYMWQILLKKDYSVKWTEEGAREEYIRIASGSMLSCGGNFTGFVTKNNQLYMWGKNDSGQLGNGLRIFISTPTPQFIMGDTIQVSCGGLHTGAVTTKGKLYMWGANNFGQLGFARGNRKNPTLLMEDIAQVKCGDGFTGAVTRDGKLYMWGENTSGQLGDGTTATNNKPTLVDMENLKVIQVSCGEYHTGAITTEGELYMWGSYWKGPGEDCKIYKPISFMKDISQVSCASSHTGAVAADGKLYMWGYNEDGQLGDGTSHGRRKPTLIKIKGRVVQVSCGYKHTGAVTEDGSLYMWGWNRNGQLGNETLSSIFTPTLIMENVVQVSCGWTYTGVITKDGRIYMWGHNEHGQLGGTKDQKLKPTLTKIPKK